ncbi:MAG TPA: 3D domain-containing protein [Terrimicrobiaceae bacterium]
MSLVIVITIRQYGHAPASPASGATPVELRIATAMEEVLLSATAVPLQSLVDNASLTNFNDVSTKLLFPLMTLESEIKLTLLKAFPSALKPGPKAASAKAVAKSRLARVTVYWPGEGDFYTRNRRSSTGTRLRDGDCAVDPKIIPYGSIVTVPGIGELIAVDTGGAVVSRRAARTFGRTQRERAAIVVDVFCSTSAKARKIVRNSQRFAEVTWRAPENASLARN